MLKLISIALLVACSACKPKKPAMPAIWTDVGLPLHEDEVSEYGAVDAKTLTVGYSDVPKTKLTRELGDAFHHAGYVDDTRPAFDTSTMRFRKGSIAVECAVTDTGESAYIHCNVAT